MGASEVRPPGGLQFGQTRVQTRPIPGCSARAGLPPGALCETPGPGSCAFGLLVFPFPWPPLPHLADRMLRPQGRLGLSTQGPLPPFPVSRRWVHRARSPYGRASYAGQRPTGIRLRQATNRHQASAAERSAAALPATSSRPGGTRVTPLAPQAQRCQKDNAGWPLPPPAPAAPGPGVLLAVAGGRGM